MADTFPIPIRDGLLRRALRRKQPRDQTAFVLSGGASLGSIQVGMIHALYERGIVPDLLVGTSAGALNAGFLASRPPTVGTAQDLAEVWTNLRRETLFPLSVPGLVSGLRGRRDHLVSDQGLRDLATEHLEFELLEDAAIPLHITTYDVTSGEDVRLSSGPALEAVLAASAIPGVFPPVEFEDRLLVDGGVVNNTPLSHAVELGARRIFVLPTQLASSGSPVRPRGALDAAVNAISLLINRRLQDDVTRYQHVAEITVLQPVNEERVQATDFTRAAELIEATREAARDTLDELEERQRLAS